MIKEASLSNDRLKMDSAFFSEVFWTTLHSFDQRDKGDSKAPRTQQFRQIPEHMMSPPLHPNVMIRNLKIGAKMKFPHAKPADPKPMARLRRLSKYSPTITTEGT